VSAPASTVQRHPLPVETVTDALPPAASNTVTADSTAKLQAALVGAAGVVGVVGALAVWSCGPPHPTKPSTQIPMTMLCRRAVIATNYIVRSPTSFRTTRSQMTGRSQNDQLAELSRPVGDVALAHTEWSEPQLRFVRVVCPAAQLEVRRLCRPAVCERDDVVELEKACRRASAGGSDECAAPLVARPDGAFNGGRNVARCRVRLDRRAPSVGLRQRLPFQLRQQQHERAIEDD